jgi:lipopolysaccharide transport system ATP-binding protein
VVVSKYLNNAFAGDGSLAEVWPDIASAPGNDSVRLHRVRVRPKDGPLSEPLTTKTPFLIEVEYWNLVPNAKLHVTLHLHTENQVIAFTTGSAGSDPESAGRPTPAGLFRATCYVPPDLLNVGRHSFKILIVKDLTHLLYQHESGVSFEVLDLEERELSQYGREPGVVKPALKWTTEQLGTV